MDVSTCTKATARMAIKVARAVLRQQWRVLLVTKLIPNLMPWPEGRKVSYDLMQLDLMVILILIIQNIQQCDEALEI